MKYSGGYIAPFNEKFTLSEKIYPDFHATYNDTMFFPKIPQVAITHADSTTSNFAQNGGAKKLKKYKKIINTILNKLSKKYLKNKKTNIRKIIKNEFKK